MKIRNHKQREWILFPKEGPTKIFKHKSALMKYINANLDTCINGYVRLGEKTFNASYTLREWFIWYNDYIKNSSEPIKAELRQVLFRGKKYISKSWSISKEDKLYFAFSDKIFNLMFVISEKGIDKNKANNLMKLFKKRGFKDFQPDEETQEYINSNINNIPWTYWSDRCNFARCKAILEYFKKENLIDN